MNINALLSKAKIKLPVAVCGLILGFSPLGVKAAPLLVTLNDVTFADNAVATGTFVFDPATTTYGVFNILTTVGIVGDTYAGSTYDALFGTTTNFFPGTDAYIFDNSGVDFHYLSLSLDGTGPNGGHITGPGTYPLSPGTLVPGVGFNNSGEFVDAVFNARVITRGNLIVVGVPEPASMASMVIGGILLSVRRKRRSA